MENDAPIPRDARILAINVCRIGDTLFMTPALAALKAAVPGGHLTCLAHPKRIEVLRGLPSIDELAGITKRGAIWRGRFGRKAYDIAFVWGRDKALVAYALRVSRKVVAFRQDDPALDGLLYRAVARVPDSVTSVDSYFALPASVGVAMAGRRIQYAVHPAERAWACEWLEKRCGGIEEILPVCVQTGSFPTKPYRDWPEQNFIALGQRLLAHDPKIALILLGDEGDRERARRIAHACGPRAHVSAGELTLRQSAALMSLARLYVGVDTGLTHLAGALGLPMVALYHCLHPGKYLAPREHPAPLAIMEHPAAAEACDASQSMDRIPVAAVWSAAEKILSESYLAATSD